MKTFLIIVFGILPAFGLIHLLRTYLFALTAVRTKATIIGYDEQEKEVAVRRGGLTRTRVFRYPIVRFKTQAGATHTVTMGDERPKADRASPNEIAVIYPKMDPKRARIAHWHARYGLPFFWFAPALAVSIVLLLFTLVAVGDSYFPKFFSTQDGGAMPTIAFATTYAYPTNWRAPTLGASVRLAIKRFVLDRNRLRQHALYLPNP